MIDTLYPKNSNKFLMSRFLSPSFKDYTVLDGQRIIFKNLKKAYYGEFYFHCIKHNNGEIKAILTADINCYGKYEAHQYVIWKLKNSDIYAATLLNGDEDLNYERIYKTNKQLSNGERM